MTLRNVASLPCSVVPFRGTCPLHLWPLATAAFFLNAGSAPGNPRDGQDHHPGQSERGCLRHSQPLPSRGGGIGRAGSWGISAALASGERVKLSGFGVFTV